MLFRLTFKININKIIIQAICGVENNNNFLNYFLGIGFANLIIVFLGNVYYEVILAWSLRYLVDSFSSDLPWKYCSNKWNSHCCNEKLLYGNNVNSTLQTTSTAKTVSTISSAILQTKNSTVKTIANCSKFNDPITEYWEYVSNEKL